MTLVTPIRGLPGSSRLPNPPVRAAGDRPAGYAESPFAGARRPDGTVLVEDLLAEPSPWRRL